MEHFNIHEDPDFECEEGCRVFRRPAMGTGVPYCSIPYDDDDGLVYPHEIMNALAAHSIPEHEWTRLNGHM